MKKFAIKLQDRSVIELQGEDCAEFLQGLMTNDIKNDDTKLTYSLMQSPKGRFLYDFFIFYDKGSFFLDIFKSRSDEIVKKLNFYKLRRDIKIINREEMKVLFSFDNFFDNDKFHNFTDPRLLNFGFRSYALQEDLENTDVEIKSDQNFYEINRILNKIPESEKDLFYDKSIAVEYGLDNFNAISYEKGCYVGQELTARTHYIGQVRKKIFLVKLKDFTKLQKGDKVFLDSQEVGIALSCASEDEDMFSLIFVKTQDDEFINKNRNNLLVNNCKIELIK
jgi:tRNA-modifying protein YgfZ